MQNDNNHILGLLILVVLCVIVPTVGYKLLNANMTFCSNYNIGVVEIYDTRMTRVGRYLDFKYYDRGYLKRSYISALGKDKVLYKKFMIAYNEYYEILLFDKEVTSEQDSIFYVKTGIEDSQYFQEKCKQ